MDARDADFALNRKILELETLYDVGMAMTSELDIDALTDEILVRLVGVLDLRAGFLQLVDEAAGRLQTVASFGINEAAIHRLCLSASPDLVTRVLETGTSHVANHFNRNRTNTPCRHLMLIPLRAREEILGILGVMDKESRETDVLPFTEDDKRLASAFANQAGVAVSNARLYRNILDVRNYNQNILSSISSGVISTDLNGCIVSVNRSAQRILGLENEEVVGTSCQALADRLQNDEIRPFIQAALDTGTGGEIPRIACQANDRHLVLDIRISPLISQDDRLNGLVITLDDLSEENRIRRIFTRYVSDPVVDMVLQPDTRPAPGGDFREVVIVFTDLRGFTRIQETQDPEETVRMLNEYYEIMFDIITRHNGTLSRIAGDGLLILYGAPISFDDDMGRAIRTVLDMREALILLNERRTATGKEPLGMGVGISVGRVLAGNVGSPRRMEYTVIGDPVNLAARLVDIADSCQILVSEEVFRQARDRFHVQHLRTIRMKGKQRPVNIYELEGADHDDAESEVSQDKEKTVKRPSGEVDLTIPLLPEMELAASKTAAAVAEFMGLDENKIEEIRLALIEACVNAIEHSKSKDRKIHISFAIHDNDLEITIQDFGEGFDTEDIRRRMAKRASSDKLLKRGWGLTLMEELMDDVEMQSGSKGTTIRMVKKR